jgi:hypothetical protein
MAETIRACRREDIPAVAGMFSRVFLQKRVPADGLVRYFDELVLDGHLQRGDSRSRVFVDTTGRVRGFIGVWPRRMVLQGRSIEGAAAGSLMVEQPELHPTAGARLLRAFLSGPQDLSFSETSNAISQRMWQKAGGERLTATSVDWLRILRPAGLATHLAGNAFAPAGWLSPLAKIADRIIQTRSTNPLLSVARADDFTDADATVDEISGVIGDLSQSYTLHPDWQMPDLPALMAHAETKERFGPIHRRIVYGRNGAPVGCYLYHAQSGGVGRVLQLLARPEAVGIALDSLLHHAAELGCVGVRGRTEFDTLDPLIVRGCVLFHVSAMMVHARDKSLLAEVRNARSMLTGLAGESWTRLIGGKFV